LARSPKLEYLNHLRGSTWIIVTLGFPASGIAAPDFLVNDGLR
jgi:hypothetical protein